MIAVPLLPQSNLNIVRLELERAAIRGNPVMQLRHGEFVVLPLVIVHVDLKASDVEGALYFLLCQLGLGVGEIEEDLDVLLSRLEERVLRHRFVRPIVSDELLDLLVPIGAARSGRGRIDRYRPHVLLLVDGNVNLQIQLLIFSNIVKRIEELPIIPDFVTTKTLLALHYFINLVSIIASRQMIVDLLYHVDNPRLPRSPELNFHGLRNFQLLGMRLLRGQEHEDGIRARLL